MVVLPCLNEAPSIEGVISSAPGMGGAAREKAANSSGAASGTTRDFGSIGSNAPQTPATTAFPISRQ